MLVNIMQTAAVVWVISFVVWVASSDNKAAKDMAETAGGMSLMAFFLASISYIWQ